MGKIFVDLTLGGAALQELRAGTVGYELVFPEKPATSVLAQAEADPGFLPVEIAFGQPDTDAVAGAERLKWIHVSSSGYTRYDTPEFRALVKKRGIAVSNSASVYDEACATHMLGFLMAQARQLPAALASRAPNGSPEWAALRARSSTLRGDTALILGFGAIGRRLVELLRPLGVGLLAYRRRARGDEGIPVVEDLAQALAVANHVINILPDSAETRGFFDERRFGGVKPGAIFYNIGRGTTVDQAALASALRSGRLEAAWLDVTDPEPLPPEHPLWALPNCHITPHIAGGHGDEALTLVRHFLGNFRRYLGGEPLGDRIM